MIKYNEPTTVREFCNALITCLLPIEIIKASDPNHNKLWRGFKEDIDECEYADFKIFNFYDGTLCGIYLDKIIIWIE